MARRGRPATLPLYRGAVDGTITCECRMDLSEVFRLFFVLLSLLFVSLNVLVKARVLLGQPIILEVGKKIAEHLPEKDF